MTTESELQIDVPQLVREAHERCQAYLAPTPLEYSIYLSDLIEGDIWLKLDSMQRTSSFKFRGAINKILTLTEEELDKGWSRPLQGITPWRLPRPCAFENAASPYTWARILSRHAWNC